VDDLEGVAGGGGGVGMWAPWRGRGGVGGGLHAGPPGATFILVTAPPVAGRADRRPVRAGAPTAGSRDPAARGRARARPPPQRQPTAPLAPSGRPTGARKDDTATTVTQPPAMCRVGRRDDRAWRRRTETKEPARRAAAHTPTGRPAGGGARPPSSPAGGVRLRGARRRPSAAAVARPVPTAGRHGARRRPRGARGACAARRGGAAAAARGGGAADRRRRGSVWPRDARPRCGRVASPTPTGGRARAVRPRPVRARRAGATVRVCLFGAGAARAPPPPPDEVPHGARNGRVWPRRTGAAAAAPGRRAAGRDAGGVAVRAAGGPCHGAGTVPRPLVFPQTRGATTARLSAGRRAGPVAPTGARGGGGRARPPAGVCSPTHALARLRGRAGWRIRAARGRTSMGVGGMRLALARGCWRARRRRTPS